ncbi:PAS domain S-box protein [Rapidithrix thailandica]|uniref:histidine kinase n=1 Tax=Rapidithrix thailandica TaxID=413964 RepID=A0AAW9S2Z4_9BACT
MDPKLSNLISHHDTQSWAHPHAYLDFEGKVISIGRLSDELITPVHEQPSQGAYFPDYLYVEHREEFLLCFAKAKTQQTPQVSKLLLLEQPEEYLRYSISPIIHHGAMVFLVFFEKIKIPLQLTETEGDAAQHPVQPSSGSTIEKRLEFIAKATLDGIYDWDRQQRKIWGNKGFYRMLGVEEGQDVDIQEWWTNQIHQDDRPYLLEKIAWTFQHKLSKITHEYRINRPDGSYIYVLDHGYILYNQKQEAERIVGAITDITQMKEAEIQLKASEEKFRRTFSSAPVPIAIFRSDDGSFVDVNASFLEFSGFSKRELIGQSAGSLGLHLLSGKGSESAEDNVAFELNSQKRSELEFSTKTGEKRFVLVSSEWVQIDHVACVLTMLYDITERKLAEEKILENQRLVNSINQNLTEGIYRTDDSGNFVYVNKAFIELFGLKEQEGGTKTSFGALFSEGKKHLELLGKLANEGCIKDEEIKMLRQDGSQFWGLHSCILSKDTNGEVFYDGAIVDITNRKQYEQLLEDKNVELEKINKELDRFVYSASHDLRAPLTSILGLLNIAKYDVKEPVGLKYLDMIKTSAERLQKFIKDLINYSRNSRTQLNIEEVNFKQLIDETFEELKFAGDWDKIRKELHFQEQDGFYTDAYRLKMIFNNLIVNSIKYHRFRQEDPYLYIDVTVNQDKVTILIKDNGRGISQDHLDHIFDMFYRAAEDSEGSGLGLYIVKETIHRLKGSIQVSSKEREGTLFTIALPNLISELE